MKEILGDAPDIVFEHVGQATFPTSVFVVKPFGKVVICGATSGYNLDFDVRYLWMRQKQIIGSHFANAWEATKANELIEQSKIRPVLWRVMPFLVGSDENRDLAVVLVLAHQLVRLRDALERHHPPQHGPDLRLGRSAHSPWSPPRRWRSAIP